MLEPERLLLRQWRDDDLEPYIQLNADPKVMEFFPSIWTREESMASFQSARDHMKSMDGKNGR